MCLYSIVALFSQVSSKDRNELQIKPDLKWNWLMRELSTSAQQCQLLWSPTLQWQWQFYQHCRPCCLATYQGENFATLAILTVNLAVHFCITTASILMCCGVLGVLWIAFFVLLLLNWVCSCNLLLCYVPQLLLLLCTPHLPLNECFHRHYLPCLAQTTSSSMLLTSLYFCRSLCIPMWLVLNPPLTTCNGL